MENHGYSSIIGAPSSPYVTSLAATCGLATRSYGVTYPSLPNYIAATSGGTQGVHDDKLPAAHPLRVPSIFSQVPGWRSYQESMPSACRLTNAYPYMPKHNPAAYYTGIRTACRTQDVPLPAKPTFDAPFTLVTPNMCHDTHDCSVAVGDAWLSAFVPKVLASPQYLAGDTVLIITWDTDAHDQANRIATVVVAPSVRPGTRSGTRYDHYSLLRTTEELLGRPLLGKAKNATSMRAGFNL